jgi:hypothetical protein
MSEEQNIPKDINGIFAWAKNNLSILLLSFLGIGGTGTGIGFSDTIKKVFMEELVTELDSTYNIRPLPLHLDMMIVEAEKYRNKTDSNFYNISNFMSYQIGFNNNIALTDNKIDTICNGIPMQYNTLNETFHVEWDGYVYTATKVGKDTWAIYLFQWQLEKGQSNYFEIDPLYYTLR